MPTGDHTTLTAVPAPTVIAIGCTPDLQARCARALAATGVAFKNCEISGAATMVAARQPLVVVLAEDVYAFDPDEFDALARDVRASLLRVEEDIAEAKLELLLCAAIDASIERRLASSVIVALPTPSTRSDDGGPPSWTLHRKRSRSGTDVEAAPRSEGSRT